MKFAIKYCKNYPVFYAWNLDDSEQETDYYNHILNDQIDSDLYDELSKYGGVDCVAEGIYRYYTQEEFNAMISNAKEVVVIQNPTKDELEEFMTDFYKYDWIK